jgi:hypothetical protein
VSPLRNERAPMRVANRRRGMKCPLYSRRALSRKSMAEGCVDRE